MKGTEDFEARSWDAAFNNVWDSTVFIKWTAKLNLSCFFCAKYQDAQQYNFLVKATRQEVRKF